jgi:hypothetical protein
MNTPLPPADLRARVLSAARSEPVAPRPAGAWHRTLTACVGVGAAFGVLLSIGGPGVYGRPATYTLVLAALWALVCAVGAWAGVSRGPSMLGRPATWRVLVVILAPLALILTAQLAGALWPPPFLLADTGKHLECIEFTTLMALGPLIAFMFLRRGSDPVAPRLTGAAIGTVSGAIGAVCIELRCSHATLFHVAAGHVLPVVMLAVLGALVAGRVVAVRAPAGAPRAGG